MNKPPHVLGITVPKSNEGVIFREEMEQSEAIVPFSVEEIRVEGFDIDLAKLDPRIKILRLFNTY